MRGRAKAAISRKGTIGELLFFLAFFFFILKYTFDITTLMQRPEMINSLLVGLCIACSMAKIMLQRYMLLRLVLTIAICAVISFSSWIGFNYLFLLGFLLILGMQDIDLEKVVRFSFRAKIISIGIHVLIYIPMYFLNPASIDFVYRGGASIVPRHYFFMGHANTFSAFLIWTCFDYIFINYKKLRVLHMAIIWLITLVSYSFAYTNTSLIVLAIATVLITLDKLFNNVPDKLFTFLAKYVYLFSAVFFPFLIVIYTRLDSELKELWHLLDDFFTGRLWLGAYAYYDQGPTFFGRAYTEPKKVFWEGRWFDTLTIFDNHYIGNFLLFGIIHSVMTALVFIILARRMENREKIIIIAFSFYCIMDAQVMILVICSALFIIGKYLYPAKKELTL